MRTSQRLIAMIKKEEGFRAKMYNCPAGHCTIGYGTKLHDGPICGHPSEEPYKNGITEERALELLLEEVERVEAAILRFVKVPLTQGQFDALVDFVYNLGSGRLQHSTLLYKLNGGDYAGAAKEFGRWVFAGKSKLPGLVARRAKEMEMFNEPVQCI